MVGEPNTDANVASPPARTSSMRRAQTPNEAGCGRLASVRLNAITRSVEHNLDRERRAKAGGQEHAAYDVACWHALSHAAPACATDERRPSIPYWLLPQAA
jgi:hypothetical protein